MALHAVPGRRGFEVQSGFDTALSRVLIPIQFEVSAELNHSFLVLITS